MLQQWIYVIVSLVMAGLPAMVTAQVDPFKREKAGQMETLRTTPLRPVKSLSHSPSLADAIIYNDLTASRTVFELLIGRVAGVQVTGGPDFYYVRIRNAQGPPLVVIDDLPFYSQSDGDINFLVQTLPPQEISRVEIIKGLAGGARYGSQARNGVIIIYTKRGYQDTIN
jgi:outer membrane cobalamin receptor